MKYIEIRQFGEPEVLQLAEREKPTPKEQEVLIEVHAAGINRPDCLQRQGHYPPPPGATDVLGLEVSGKIIACGPQVKRWKTGDSVCALLAGGGYSEYAVAPEGQCLPIPANLNFIEAAALPETFFTVWTNVFEGGSLSRGESILIHGGSGGIGTTAIQLAHVMGAKVFTTVGKRDSVTICESLGADEVILYKSEDFVEAIQRFTDRKGVNVILDMVGGEYFAKNLECLASQGRLVQIATQKGSKVELDLRTMMAKRLMLTGSTLRPRSVAEKSRIAQALEKNVWPLFATSSLKPLIYKVLPLAQAAEGHRLMESSQHIGKIVLQVRN